MRTAIRRLGASLTLALAASAAPVSAAPTSGLVVTAPSNAYVELSFARATRLDIGRWSATGSGTYTGFYLTSRDRQRPFEVGSIQVSGFASPGFDSARLLLGRDYLASPDTPNRTVPAGRYRLYVLSDRAVRLTIPTPGTSTRTMTASRRASAAVAQGPLSPAVAGQPATILKDWPLAVPTSSVSVVGLRVVADRAFMTDAYVADLCLMRTSDHVCSPDDPGEHYDFEEARTGTVGLGAQVSHLDLTYYGAGKTTPAQQIAHLSALGTPLVKRAYGFALTLAL